MAIKTLVPLSEASGFRRRPTDNHAKLRYLYWKIVNDAVAGDDGSFVELGTLPPGAVRLLPRMAQLRSSAFGAARVLKIGHRAYFSADGQTSANDIDEDDDAFSVGLDISAAAFQASPFGTAIKYDIYSKSGVRLFGTVTGGTIPAAAELEGYIPYAYE